jgi:hypothetical protein
MKEEKKNEEKESSSKDGRKRLMARIPITEWYDLERRMEIMSRMTTAREPPALNPGIVSS